MECSKFDGLRFKGSVFRAFRTSGLGLKSSGFVVLRVHGLNLWGGWGRGGGIRIIGFQGFSEGQESDSKQALPD